MEWQLNRAQFNQIRNDINKIETTRRPDSTVHRDVYRIVPVRTKLQIKTK